MLLIRILITGGSGFIGSALVRHLITHTDHQLLNFDALTYAASPEALQTVATHPRYRFVRGDILDGAEVRDVLADFRPQAICHLAAETHVDRSIDQPDPFIETNINGTHRLLVKSYHYWSELPAIERAAFRFLYASTDEVYGSISEGAVANEHSRYDPRSPYSASKASAEHLVSAWGVTYGLPVTISHGCNAYGPWQNPEKLIPKAIALAMGGHSLPLYGDGLQTREWLHVDDQARALQTILERGEAGRHYNIGSGERLRNAEVVHAICDLLDTLSPRPDGQPHTAGIVHVTDRPGHDRRYALDSSRIRKELGWQPQNNFTQSLGETVEWYVHRERSVK